MTREERLQEEIARLKEVVVEMTTLYLRTRRHEQELEERVLSLEWAANAQDSKGQRCPQCWATRSDGHNPETCRLADACEKIRKVQLLRRLVEA